MNSDSCTSSYAYNKANQLVTSTVNGKTTHYKYDAAGRMIQAGDKTYIYNGRNKVVEVRQNGKTIAKFEYNIDGQIAKAIYGDKVEEFMWDGLALIWRIGVTYINEPYVTGGNPVLAGDEILFNDMLGSTLAVNGNSVEMTSFGETGNKNAFFTGKPMIDELGYSFLLRDYTPHQGKWTTTDPLGYPDGWNNLAYVNNQIWDAIDKLGASVTYRWGDWQIQQIIGLNGNTASGYMYGNSIAITWKITVTWTCTDCKKTGTETFYDTTKYSNQDVVWSAPRAALGLSIPTATTLPGLVGEFCASLLDDLIGKQIATGLTTSHIQESNALKKPTKLPTFNHKCE